MEKRTQFNLGYFLFALFMVLALQHWWTQAQQVEILPYSEFEKLLQQNRIDEVVISEQRITGRLKSPEGGKTVAVANLVSPDLAERLDKYGVKYTRVYESTWLRDLLSWVVPALVFFGVWYVKGAYDKAVAILGRAREVLERGAQQLLERETLAESELAEFRNALGSATG